VNIVRVKLENYRDIDTRELSFPEKGVIVIQGPNDIGKSSLAEAINIVLDYKATSSHRTIQAIKPVDRDVGSLVELEIKSGDYHFTVTKVFNRNRSTTLTVHAPLPENWTGDDAHNRLLEILAETLDFDLWRALSVEQGAGMSQARLGDAGWLQKALDAAAGRTTDGISEEPLFERVAAERTIYYTNTGRPTGALQALSTEETRLEVELKSLQNDANQLQSDVVQAETVDRDLRDKSSSFEKLEQSSIERQADAAEVEKLRQGQATLQAQSETANTQVESAQLALATRHEKIKAVDEAVKRVEALDQLSPDNSNSLELGKRLEKLEANFQTEDRERIKAETTLATYRSDLTYLRDEFELERFVERKERLKTANDEAKAAEQWLGSHRISEELVTAVEQSHFELEIARAAVQEASTTLELRALSDISVDVDGMSLELNMDATASYPVVDPVTLSVPGQLIITVSPGSTAEDLAKSVAEKELRYAKACQEIGASDLDEARSLLKTAEEHHAALKIRDQVVKTALQDLSETALDGWITRYGERVKTYSDHRRSDIPMPGGQEEARGLIPAAEKESKNIAAVVEEISSELQEVRRQIATLKAEQAEHKIRRDVEQKSVEQLSNDLVTARRRESDASLNERVQEFETGARKRADQLSEAKAALDKRNPEQIELLASNAQQAVGTAAEQLAELRDLRTGLRARLDAFGERGIGESLADAESLLEQNSDEHRRILRRAKAADLLYQTMEKRRSSAKTAYIGPLRAEIERKGKIIFNNSFGVEIDEHLTVVNRTLDKKTVPYDGVGGGAKEQIAMMARLAVGELVSDEGGVPLIFDDVLGYSDPEKLERISAVLAAAGENAQIIVLTCQPDRYQHIGSATICRLP